MNPPGSGNKMDSTHSSVTYRALLETSRHARENLRTRGWYTASGGRAKVSRGWSSIPLFEIVSWLVWGLEKRLVFVVSLNLLTKFAKDLLHISLRESQR